MTDRDVADLIEALRRMTEDDVALVETHISWVLLVGEYALKIKKPVDLGFVDFSTLERRRRFCEEELRLNRRLAPELYLDLVAIGGTPDEPVLDGGGEPFEFAVRMHRFDQNALLANVLAHGELMPHHVDAFAVGMADFHDRIATDGEATTFGTPEDVWQPVERNFETLLGASRDPVQCRRLDDLRAWSAAEWERLHDAFECRRRNGFVRECHGDAHLGNAILACRGGREEVLLFDGIEFSPELRWIDVVSDAAFAVMDLADRGRPDLANRFLNTYLECTGDYAGLVVLPFYLLYRSLVRAKVAEIRRGQAGIEVEERARLAAEFNGYLRLAERCAQCRSPRLVITSGVSGSGKSTVAQKVVEELGAIRIRSDVERKRLAECSGEGVATDDLYSQVSSDRTYDRLCGLARVVVQAGFTPIVDATFLERARRADFRRLATELHVPFVIAHVVAETELLRARVAGRARDGTDASDADLEVLSRQLDLEESLRDDEADVIVEVQSADRRSIENLVSDIVSRCT